MLINTATHFETKMGTSNNHCDENISYDLSSFMNTVAR